MSNLDLSPVRTYIEGDPLFDDMLSAVRGARERISLESYILAWDEVGRPLLEAMAEKARDGVKVRLHVDAFGSLFKFPRAAERWLESQGVRVRRFHRWSWRQPHRYNRRNHRKMLVVDRQVVFLGGFNLHRENSRRVYGEQRWRDSHARVASPMLAHHAQVLFDLFWSRNHRRYRPSEHPADPYAILANFNVPSGRRMRQALDSFMSGARRSLWFTTPYFVPSHHIQNRLIEAVARGVDVRVLVPAKNDVRLARWASHAAYARLLEHGVRIFEYCPRVLHAKTLLVDGEWGSIGSSNLDYRSIFTNYEVNLVFNEPTLCRELAEEFLADLEESQEIHPSVWARRHWLHYPAEFIGWLARRWL